MGEATGAAVEHLERLDRVVHDFMACLPSNGHTPPEGGELGNVARFIRVLAHSPLASGAVLGPPAFCGVSPAIGIESVLGFLGSLRKTGVLRVLAPDDTTFRISVVRGDVVHGVANPRPEEELLGNILLARGLVSRTELDRFLEACASSASQLIEGLNREQLVNTDDLRRVLEEQMQRLFDRLLGLKSSEWCFHEGEATVSCVNMRMNVNSVLLESARKCDEARNLVAAG